MLQALERYAGDVVPLGPEGELAYGISGAIRRALRLFGMRIDSTHTVAISRRLGRAFSAKLRDTHFDAIFAPAASTELAFLETNLPVVTYDDLTIRLFRGYAAHLQDLFPWSVRQMELLGSRALTRADIAVFSSEWAAASAREHYGVPADKIRVVPMGANVEPPPEEELLRTRRQRPAGSCRLLFIASDWQRKGGDIALGTLAELRRRGIDAGLTIVGCSPPPGTSDTAVRVIPFLDKNDAVENRLLMQLFLNSDFLLMPSRREAYGVAPCEANAFALPPIVSGVGGIPVVHNQNGIVISPNAPPSAWAEVIQRLLADPAGYFALATAGRRAWEQRLNWDAWGKAMNEVLQQAISQRTSRASA